MSRKLSVLVVGVGSIGERHLRCFLNTQRASLSCCEINADLGQSVAKRYALDRVYTRYDEALAAEPDIVVICTPAHLHIRMARQAVDRRASVLIEKPLSTTWEGVDELIQRVDEQALTAGVAYVYRCHPALQAMRRAILDGRFGVPLTIVTQSGQFFPLYRPAYREIYYRDRKSGGGAVQDAMTHVINAAEWLVGPIDRLVADIDHLMLEGVEVEDTVHVLTRHGPVMGCFHLNQHQAPNESTLTVVCSQGTARFEFHANRWRWMSEPGSDWHDEALPTLERDALFTIQANAFLDAVEGRCRPLCTIEESKQTLAVNLAILRSAESGSWQSIQAAQASGLDGLDREKR